MRIGFIEILASCFFLAGVAAAENAPEPEWKKLQRIEAAEFCSVVKPPPKQLVETLTESAKQDPVTWLPSLRWIEKLGIEYQKRGCRDA